MKKAYGKTPALFFLLAAFFCSPLTSEPAVFSPELKSRLELAQKDEEISILVSLSDKVDLHQINARDKSVFRSTAIKALRERASVAHRPIKNFLESKRASKIRPLWLINGIAVTVPASVIEELGSFPSVEEIRLDRTISVPVVAPGISAVTEWNLNSIHAPELWNLGYTGAGVVVANMDTGVDANHPDLANKWRGGTNSWFDPHSEHNTPYDVDGHGTQVMGIIVGGDSGGTAIGVSPGSTWIAVKVFNDAGQASYSAVHEGFQWLLDPDGNPDTDDAPDVVNNSWGLGESVNECVTEFETDVLALRTSGIAVVFSAGNSGPYPSSSVSPANYPESFAVGAVNETMTIASFSSRGPSACGPDTYPDVVAPGVNIRTSDMTFGGVFPDSYRVVSGTSFSAPHVAGTMALLLSAFPDLTVSELELALKLSALDLGALGEDTAYGSGLIDVSGAYSLLLNPSPDISAHPASLNFGRVKEGRVSSRQSLIVANQGMGNLMVNTLTTTGSEFNINSDGCSGRLLAPAETCAVEVVFAPTSGGEKSDELLISSNDAEQNPYPVTLNGRGIERYSLEMSTAGTGAGKVISDPAGINCDAGCSQLFKPGTIVNLNASPEAGSSFGGWSGCNWSSGKTCQVRMGRDKEVVATFDGPSLTVTAPNGGEAWTSGTFKKIKWVYTGRPGDFVRIELLDGNAVVKVIAKGASGGKGGVGRLIWFVPRTLPDGKDYRIRITSTKNDAYRDVSDQSFEISP